jgi:hypothetical protein
MRPSIRRFLICCASGLLAPLARADVTVTQHLTTSGFGSIGLGAMEGTTVTSIAGNRARSEGTFQFKSRLLRVLTRHLGDSLEIIRLDEDRVYEVDMRHKSYTEMSFADFRAQEAKAAQQMQEAQNQHAATSSTAVDESQCEWSSPKSEVKQTGEHASIAGIDTQRAVVSVTQSCTDKKEGQTCDFVFQLDEWLAADVPGSKEQREFWQAYAQKLDLHGEVTALQARGGQMVFGRYKDAWKEALTNAASLQGQPLRTVVAIQVGGPQCKTAEQSQPERPSVTENPAAAVVGLLGKLRKKHAEPEPADAATAPPPGMVELFRMTTETTAITTDAVAADKLQVPAGFKKKEASGPDA